MNVSGLQKMRSERLKNTTATVSRWPCAQGAGAFVALR
jgi:tRNA(Arg) A34 adenosine deaminase TadA